MNDWLPGGESHRVALPNLHMHVVTAGPKDGTPVLLLHGFPEFWYSWRHQIPALAEAGYRVIAPDQRGYNLTGKSGPYDLATLVRDVADLLDAMHVTRCHVVGHDWGGVVAWAFVGRCPDRVLRHVSLNGPHPSAYADACRRHFSQIRMSWYIYFFQLPGLAEWAIRRNGFAVLDKMFRGIPKDLMTAQDIQRYKDALAVPGALSAALGWYRAAFRTMLRQRMRPPALRVAAPTLVIWGERDVALSKACNETLARYVDDLRLVYLPQASHWVQMDHPAEVNRRLLDFFAPDAHNNRTESLQPGEVP